ncbi:MAG: hypothetical protein KDJ52_06230 [Anaerolineae bacterium]|nr:hypothetical protein [Anaerolineae bacterium]
MTTVTKSSDEAVISLPAWLMESLNLKEGDEIKAFVEGATLRIAPLDKFLALRGVLKDDEAFDEALDYLDKDWQSWTIPPSV